MTAGLGTAKAITVEPRFAERLRVAPRHIRFDRLQHLQQRGEGILQTGKMQQPKVVVRRVYLGELTVGSSSGSRPIGRFDPENSN